MKVTFYVSQPALYDGEGEGDAAAKAAADAAAAKAAADKAGGGGDEVKDQAGLNKVLKREKEKFRKERETLISQMEDLKQKVGKGMSAEEREAFENQIEELRAANMTTEEQARRQKEKLDKEWQSKFQVKEQEANTWQSRHQNLLINYEINKAAQTHKVLSNSVAFVEALLAPKTRLVEGKDEDTGKPNGKFTPMVKIEATDKDNKPIVLDLSIADAIKHMKETPEQFGNLFEGNAAGGMGGNTGKPGKKANVANMTTAEYMAARKKDPASVGL